MPVFEGVVPEEQARRGVPVPGLPPRVSCCRLIATRGASCTGAFPLAGLRYRAGLPRLLGCSAGTRRWSETRVASRSEGDACRVRRWFSLLSPSYSRSAISGGIATRARRGCLFESDWHYALSVTEIDGKTNILSVKGQS